MSKYSESIYFSLFRKSKNCHLCARRKKIQPTFCPFFVSKIRKNSNSVTYCQPKQNRNQTVISYTPFTGVNFYPQITCLCKSRFNVMLIFSSRINSASKRKQGPTVIWNFDLNFVLGGSNSNYPADFYLRRNYSFCTLYEKIPNDLALTKILSSFQYPLAVFGRKKKPFWLVGIDYS